MGPITALLSNQRLILRQTPRIVTAFDGLATFITLPGKIGLVEKLHQHIPIRWKSPNHIDPTSTFTAFLMAVLAGTKGLAHASLPHGDPTLHSLLGLKRFPSDDRNSG